MGLLLLTGEAAHLALESPRLEFWGSLFKTVFSLALVLGLIFLINKLLLPKLIKTPRGGQIQILAKTHLEPQVTTYLLGFEQKRWIVLVGRTSATILHQFDANT